MIAQIFGRTHKQPTSHQHAHQRLFLIVLILLFCSVNLFSVDQADSPAPRPQNAVVRAWELAQASGTYQYRSEIEQTTYPAPSITNAGRQPQQDHITLEGDIDIVAETMAMTLWTDSSYNPDTGIQIRVENGEAYGRLGEGKWEAIDNVADAFAPGGDPLSFVAGMDNVQEQGGQALALGNEQSLNLTHYTFDLNGPLYAKHLRQVLEAQLRARGELPMGVSLDTPSHYHDMTGNGALWLTADGLPHRLLIEMTLPLPENGEWAEATITTDFFDFDHNRLEAAAVPFWQSPQTWTTSQIATNPQLVQQTNLFVFFVALFIIMGWIVVQYGWSRRFYKIIVILYIISSLANPLLQGESVHAFATQQRERHQTQVERQKQAEAQEKAEQAVVQSSWNPTQDPLKAGQVAAKQANMAAATTLLPPQQTSTPAPP